MESPSSGTVLRNDLSNGSHLLLCGLTEPRISPEYTLFLTVLGTLAAHLKSSRPSSGQPRLCGERPTCADAGWWPSTLLPRAALTQCEDACRACWALVYMNPKVRRLVDKPHLVHAVGGEPMAMSPFVPGVDGSQHVPRGFSDGLGGVCTPLTVDPQHLLWLASCPPPRPCSLGPLPSNTSCTQTPFSTQIRGLPFPRSVLR